MNARFPGSVHDSRTFKKTLGMKFADGFRPLPGGVLISDSAYAASDYLIRCKFVNIQIGIPYIASFLRNVSCWKAKLLPLFINFEIFKLNLCLNKLQLFKFYDLISRIAIRSRYRNLKRKLNSFIELKTNH